MRLLLDDFTGTDRRKTYFLVACSNRRCDCAWDGSAAQARRDHAEQVREQRGGAGGMDERQPRRARTETQRAISSATAAAVTTNGVNPKPEPETRGQACDSCDSHTRATLCSYGVILLAFNDQCRDAKFLR